MSRKEASIIEELERRAIKLLWKGFNETKDIKLYKSDKITLHFNIDIDDLAAKLLQKELRERENEKYSYIKIKRGDCECQ
jgi:hypothetical protein